MKDKFELPLNILEAVLFVVGLSLFAWIILAENVITPIENGLYWAYTLLGCCILFSVVFSLVQIILLGKKGLKSLLSIVFLAAILLISWLSSDQSIPAKFVGKFKEGGTEPVITKEMVQLLDMQIYASYSLLLLSVLGILLFSLYKAVKP